MWEILPGATSYFRTNYRPRGSIVKIPERDWRCDELRPFSSSSDSSIIYLLFGATMLRRPQRPDPLQPINQPLANHFQKKLGWYGRYQNTLVLVDNKIQVIIMNALCDQRQEIRFRIEQAGNIIISVLLYGSDCWSEKKN